MGAAVLLIGAAAGGYLLATRANEPPGFTPLADGQVTRSLFQSGRNTAPLPSAPMTPGRAVIPQVGLASRGGVSTTTLGRSQGKAVPVVDLNSAALDQLQTLPGVKDTFTMTAYKAFSEDKS